MNHTVASLTLLICAQQSSRNCHTYSPNDYYDVRGLILKTLEAVEGKMESDDEGLYLVMAEAIIYTDIKVMNLCLEKGLDINARDEDGRTLLFTAVAWPTLSPEKMVKRLIEEYGANPNVVDNEGNTLLRYSEPDVKATLNSYGITKDNISSS